MQEWSTIRTPHSSSCVISRAPLDAAIARAPGHALAGTDPKLVETFAKMTQALSHASDAKKKMLLAECENSRAFIVKPKGFFHVAIDLPGHGKTEGSAKALTASTAAKLLGSTIRSLIIIPSN